MDTDRKRQGKNDYKSKPAVGAVYAIVCNGNQRRILKSTVDIGGLRNRFQFAIAIQGCPDPAMHNEWLQYGTESFSLIVLEELTIREGQTAKDFADDIKQLYELWLEKSAETVSATPAAAAEPAVDTKRPAQ